MKNLDSLLPKIAASGGFIALASIVLFLLMYSFDIKPIGIIKPILLLFLSFGMIVFLLVYFLRQRRTELNGFISFKDAFVFSSIALIINAIVYSTFIFVFLKYFEPNYNVTLLDSQIEWMENFLVKKNLSDQQIDDAINKLIDQADILRNTPAIKQAFGAMHWTIIGYIVIAVIVSLIIKRNRSIFDDHELIDS